jgi:GTPase SAR1 family protein
MPSVQPEEKTVSFKIVYCGTPLSGKTTNLRCIHSRLDPSGRGDLVALSTHRDRTLFFDFLALETAARQEEVAQQPQLPAGREEPGLEERTRSGGEPVEFAAG